ncbi:MAG: shikimate dehydrogenase [Flavobacteriia bacterium]|nr:shikimate dehydrogenase [Flavobacteriia bacterium]
MRKFGLIGKSLSHSFSKGYFTEKFEKLQMEAEYVNCELEDISEFESLATEDFDGWNVTIPYKEAIIPFLDELTHDAQAIGAVNTISRSDGKLIGHNTDHTGFEKSLLPFLEPGDTKALIFGTGGASKAVAHAFQRRGIHFAFVSRAPKPGQLSYDQLNSAVLDNVHLLVNTTPIGMYPNEDDVLPFHMDLIQSHHFVIELIYNPSETVLLKVAKQAGARAINGLNMLHWQAEEAWKIWEG